MKIETARIVNANRVELVVITLEIIKDSLIEAKENMLNKNDKYKKNIKNAVLFINELKNALDLKYKIANELMRIYDYVEMLISSVAIKNDVTKIDEALRIVDKFYVAFKQIEEANDSKAVMKNCDQIYSGFTYGKNGLNEITLGSSKRGIIA